MLDPTKTPLEQAIAEHAENKAEGAQVVLSLEQSRKRLEAAIARLRLHTGLQPVTLLRLVRSAR
jgi:hypothetical protein